MEFLADPEVWVAIGFLIVIGILLYVGAPKMVGTLLDARAAGIKAELDEARRLREEAQTLLAGYQKKASEAEREAEAIIADARAEAERYQTDAVDALGRQMDRRAQQAAGKIAQAEAAALAEIRGLAADAAAAAAEKLIAARMNTDKQSALIADSIKSLGSKLN